jgi:hypothetical protein
MVDIQTFSIVIASASVVAGVIYYALQIRNQNRTRQTDLVMKLYSNFNSPEFQKTWEQILKREAKDLQDYQKKYGNAESVTVGMFFEGIGILLKRKLIDIELVDDMFTSPIKMTWEKMKNMTLESRKIYNRPETFEWFEYLYNEMKKREQQLQQKGV